MIGGVLDVHKAGKECEEAAKCEKRAVILFITLCSKFLPVFCSYVLSVIS